MRPTPSAPAPASSTTRSRTCWRDEARDRIADLLSYGVPFDKDLEGHFSLGREAAHGRNRILHVKGDTAGRAIMACAARGGAGARLRSTCSKAMPLAISCSRDGRVAGVELAATYA